LFTGCALYLCPLHWENLVWPNQVLLYSSIFFSMLAISLAVPTSKGNWKQQVLRVILIGFFAVCATFSFGWGLVVWPVLLIHGLLSRWRWQAVLTLLILSGGTIALYFSRFMGGSHPGKPIESLSDPLSLVNFASLLLASPIVVIGGLSHTLGYVLGYLILAVVGYVAYRMYLQRQAIEDRQWRSLLVCLYCIGVCLMTALGRSNLAYRYMLIPTLFIIATLGLFPLRSAIKGAFKQTALITLLYGVIGLSVAAFFSDNALRNKQFMIREGTIAASFKTMPLYRGLSPSLDKINNHVWPYYIKHHGDSESVNMLTWLGKPIPQSALPDPPVSMGSHCMGTVDFLENRKGYPEFYIPHGWIRLGPQGRHKAEWVIITNASGVVVGIATTGEERPDVREHLKANWLDDLLTQTNRAGFNGLIRSQPGDELDFFAYDDGKCFPFAKSVKVPDAEANKPN
jgi:MFS family permease